MTSDKLESYKGWLTSQEIAEGMNAAASNAKRLLEDAEIMLRESRYASATALAILAIEESGKISILRGMSTADTETRLLSEWKRYRTHRAKNAHWILIDLVAQGARKLDDFKPLFAQDAEHPLILDQLKQISIYTDCFGKRHWSIPSQVIDASLARTIVAVARIMAGKNREVSSKEIELWIKHLGNASQMTHDAQKEALIAWNREMIEAGLATAEHDMETFVKRGL